MPNTREKLIELLFGCVSENLTPKQKSSNRLSIEINQGNIADHLIANGVTVQEEAKLYWKPVKPGEWNLTCSVCDSHLGCRENANFCPECGAKFVRPKAVMPKPSKRY